MEKTDARVAKLEKYVEKVEKALSEMVRAMKNGDFEAFSEEEIRFHLSHDPDMIAEAGLFLAKIEREYENAKTETQIALAKLWDRCNRMKETLGLSNAKDRESWVKIQPEYKQVVDTEAEWRYRVAQMRVIYNRYENLFVGSRKIGSLIEKDNENVYRREKYGTA